MQMVSLELKFPADLLPLLRKSRREMERDAMSSTIPDTNLESLLKAMLTWAQAEESIIALYLIWLTR